MLPAFARRVYLIAPRVNPDTIARWAKITRIMIGITMIMPTVLTRFQGKPLEAR
jgi:hypothetical protein